MFLNYALKVATLQIQRDLATYSTYPEAYLGPSQTSTTGLFAKIANSLRQHLKSQILIK